MCLKFFYVPCRTGIPADLIEIAFASVEEQNLAIAVAKEDFKGVVAGYLQQAFEEGRKHGKFEQYEKTHAVA